MPFLAESVQGVCFVHPSSRPGDAMATWQAIHQTTPDGYQRVANSPTLQSSANGDRDGFFSTLSVQVGRIDAFVMRQNPQLAISANEGPPRIVDVNRAISVLSEHLIKIALAHQPVRLAIVLDLAMEITPGEEATRMREQLESLNLPESASDIQFQVNVRRAFYSRPEVPMNRLCAWSIAHSGIVQIGPAGPMAGPMTPSVSLKVDVNTAPEAALPAAEAGVLIAELAEEASRLHISGLNGLWNNGTFAT